MKKIKFEKGTIVSFAVLEGKTLIACERIELTTRFDVTENSILFQTENETFVMYHDQDCCEKVEIESIVGDLQDLVGSPILQADEKVNNNNGENYDRGDDSNTWTFYTLATIKGYVDIRWHGSSNGYYSEGVDFLEISDVTEVTNG